MRKYVASLCLLLVASLLALAGMLGGAESAVKGTPHAGHPAAAAPSGTPEDPPGTIDGAVTPHLIPDATAYALLFNFFADRPEADRGKLKSYCKRSALADVDLDGLLTLARFYRQQVADVDARAEAVRGKESHVAAAARLADLRQEREAIVAQVITKVPQFVGKNGAAAVRKHIEERIKPRTKIVPGPVMPH